MKAICLLALVFFSGGAGPAGAADTACLRMGVINQIETIMEVKVAAQRIFDKAGLCLELVELPVRRSEQMTLQGDLDGEILRTELWVEQNTDQVMAVPTPFFEDHMMAMTLADRKLRIEKFSDLKPYKVVVAGGHRWAETRLAALGIDPMKASSPARYMELLRIRRVDVGLIEESLIQLVNNREGIALTRLEKLPYFIVVRKEHVGLVPRLDAALRWVQANPK